MEKIGTHLLQTRLIYAGQFSWPLSLGPLWRYRLVFWRLLQREFQVRYRQTILGVSWLMFQPLLALIIFSFVFGRIDRFAPGGIPYSVFALSGLVPWMFFNNCLLHGCTSFLDNRHVVKNIFFPHALLPLSVVISKVVDLLVSLALLVVWVLLVHPVPFLTSWFLLPLHFFMLIFFAVGLLLFLSAFCVRYRDIRFIVPFLVQVWFFATPIVYPASALEERVRWVLFLNPLAVFMEAARDAFFGSANVTPGVYLVGVLMTLSVFILGSLYFRRVERLFADVI